MKATQTKYTTPTTHTNNKPPHTLTQKTNRHTHSPKTTNHHTHKQQTTTHKQTTNYLSHKQQTITHTHQKQQQTYSYFTTCCTGWQKVVFNVKPGAQNTADIIDQAENMIHLQPCTHVVDIKLDRLIQSVYIRRFSFTKCTTECRYPKTFHMVHTLKCIVPSPVSPFSYFRR